VKLVSEAQVHGIDEVERAARTGKLPRLHFPLLSPMKRLTDERRLEDMHLKARRAVAPPR
jgi:hypothetical protein